MPAWITPTEADILTRVSGAELEAFRSAALATDQPDPVPALIVSVVNFMRGYIANCPTVDMTTKEAGTIPDSGLHVFLDIIVPTIQMRPAGAVIEGTNGIRLDSKADAMAWLKAAAACKVAVDEVPPPDAPGAPIPKPIMLKRTRPNVGGI
jgi:hypothetical protein